ncbi:hypothetical protein ACFL0E_00720 [Nanoarchaeota archaeon]
MKLSDLEKAITYSWYKDTSADSENWSNENQSYGQCAVTALIVQDYLGGKIVNSLVDVGERKESHYFNNINGTEIDLTGDQFPEGTVIPEGVDKKKDFETTRDYVLSYGPTAERYEVLKRRVDDCLDFIIKP